MFDQTEFGFGLKACEAGFHALIAKLGKDLGSASGFDRIAVATIDNSRIAVNIAIHAGTTQCDEVVEPIGEYTESCRRLAGCPPFPLHTKIERSRFFPLQVDVTDLVRSGSDVRPFCVQLVKRRATLAAGDVAGKTGSGIQLEHNTGRNAVQVEGPFGCGTEPENAGITLTRRLYAGLFRARAK